MPSQSQRVVLRGRVAARVPEDPVGFWFGRVDVDTRPANLSHLNRCVPWLHWQRGWENVSPRDVLIRYLESEDGYEALDLIQSYVNGLVLRKSSKEKTYSSIRSYFSHNRCLLPEDVSFRIKGDRPQVEAKLAVENVEHRSAASIQTPSRRFTKGRRVGRQNQWIIIDAGKKAVRR